MTWSIQDKSTKLLIGSTCTQILLSRQISAISFNFKDVIDFGAHQVIIAVLTTF